MKFLFKFFENSNTRPPSCALCKIENSDKIIFKILNISNKLDLTQAIDGPHQSYLNLTEEIQLISFLYYCGALTYAPYTSAIIMYVLLKSQINVQKGNTSIY